MGKSVWSARLSLKILPVILLAGVVLFAQNTDLRALMVKGAELDSQKRYSEAETYYQRALQIAPDSAPVLNNIGNHYLASGDKAKARKFYLKAVAIDPHHANANLQLAQMSVEEKDGKQGLMYVRRVSDSEKDDPAVILLKVRALALSGQCAEAGPTLGKLAGQTNTGPGVNLSIGMAFAQCKLYAQAVTSFSRALDADPTNFDIKHNLGLARLDLAIARFRQQGGQAALLTLDQTPVGDRNGDYYLLRAQVLDSLGKTQEAVDALNRGMRAAPTRSDLYLQASGFLLKHNLLHEALNLLEQASRVLPDDRELLLAQVVTLELLRREDDAQNVLNTIQARWPKWDRAYQLKGILLEIQLKSSEATQALETAISLGANTPEVYYYKALAITHAAPDDLDGAQKAIDHALALTSTDPYAFVLAGKIALAKKEYAKAVQYFLDAKRLQPTLVPAHYGLRDAYRELGEEQKSAAEMEEIKRLARENQSADQNPFAAEGWMFAVRPPG